MLMNVSLEKPNGRAGYVHAGALTADFEAIPKDHLPPRGGWWFEAAANLAVAVGWRIRLKAGQPWFVRAVEQAGEGRVRVTLAGQP
jgi:hypothetical protein